jgi:hypothetical protein
MLTTPHTHQVVFGRKVDGCPRCTELRIGMPAKRWSNYRDTAEAQRRADIRAHKCSIAGCGPVCTFGDW